MGQRHRSVFSVPAQPQSATAARHWLVATLQHWALPVDLDTAQLLLSEIVTNAILHGADPAAGEAVITTELAETRVGLRVEVRDPNQGIVMGSRSVPGDGDRGADLAESGRGLGVVGALAVEWGVLEESGGKCIYFVLGFDSAPCDEPTEIIGCGSQRSAVCMGEASWAVGPRRESGSMPGVPARLAQVGPTADNLRDGSGAWRGAETAGRQ